MRKQKAIIFALIGVFAVSAATVGAVLGNNFIFKNGVNASTDLPQCNKTWSKSLRPTINEDGTATLVNGYIETKYTDVSASSSGHVVLKDGGSMETSGKPYDGVNSGFVNGMKSIVVKYSGASGDNEMGHWESKIELITSFNGRDVQKQVINSGDIITFNDKLPKTFKLVATSEGTPWYGDDPQVDITSITVTATQEEQLGITATVTPDTYAGVEWYYDDPLDAKDDPAVAKTTADVNKTRFNKNTVIKVKPSNSENTYFDETKIAVTSVYDKAAQTVQKTVNKEGYPTYSFTITQDLNINIEATLHNAIYEGRDFIGTYKGIQRNTLGEHSLILDKYGKATFDGTVYDYTADAQGNIVIDKENELKVSKVGDILLVTKGYNAFAFVKGETVKRVDTLKGPEADFTVINNGTKDYKIVIIDNILIVDGVNGTITHDNAKLSKSNDLCVTVPIVDGTSVLDGISQSYVEDTNRVLRFYQQYSKPHPLARGQEVGSYSGEFGTLVLDGFGKYTLDGGAEDSYTYVAKSNEVLLKDYILIIDTGAHTYTNKPFVKDDPWLNEAKTYICNDKNETTLTFFNGKVTLESKDPKWNGITKGSYKFNRGNVTFALEYDSDEYGSYTANFDLVITDIDKFTTIGLNKDVTIDTGSSLIKSDLVFTLVEQNVNPWIANTMRYDFTTEGEKYSLTFDSKYVSVSKSIYGKAKVANYTLVGDTVSFTVGVFALNTQVKVDFKLQLVENGAKLKSLVDSKAFEKSETFDPDYEKLFIAANSVGTGTIVGNDADLFANQTAVFKHNDGTTFTFNNGTVNVGVVAGKPSANFKTTSAKYVYNFEKRQISFELEIQNPCPTAMGNIKVDIVLQLDGTGESIQPAKDIVGSYIDYDGGMPEAFETEIYTKWQHFNLVK